MRSPEAPARDAAQFAALDLGSNSFHMVVARLVDGANLQVIDRIREPVRLAAGLDAEGRLSDAAIRRGLDALARMGERVRELPAGAVRAVGTNTLRKARNRADLIVPGSRLLGHPVEVIGGWEEARLVWRGVTGHLPPGPRRLVVDLGGGSTELAAGEGADPALLESLYMGCVSWSRRYFDAAAMARARTREAAFARAVTAARLELGPHYRRFRAHGWDEAWGSSGTVLAVHRVLQAHGRAAEGITRDDLAWLRHRIVRHPERLADEPVDARRRAVLPGGVAILCAVTDALRVDRLRAAPTALREGLLDELIGRRIGEDRRDGAVRAFARRFGVDDAQARRVGRTALALLRQVAETWELAEEDDARLLGWAARLHEVGMALSHASHHKHGAYLVRNTDLAGFSTDEQAELAALVLLHRGRFSRERTRELLGWRDPERVLRLAVPLRLAVRLHRPRSATPLPALRLAAEDATVELRVAGDWLANHPLARADLDAEAERLAAEGIRFRFGPLPG